MSSELIAMPRAGIVTAQDFMPILDLTLAVQRHDMMVQIAQKLMVKDVDYGQIQGTEKPCLLKPGAEKLCSMFGLSPEFFLEVGTEDWTGKDYGQPFFYYRYKCRLTRNGILMGEGIGSCNSWESKYRWRWVQEDQLPTGLDKAKTVSRGGRISEFEFAINKAETGGKYGKPAAYWQAFKDAIERGTAACIMKPMKNKPNGERAWEMDSTVFRVPNPEIFDQVNTCQKMSQKRALIAGVLIATNASEFFTQDVEDMETVYDVPYTVVTTTTVPTNAHTDAPPSGPNAPPPIPAPTPESTPAPQKATPTNGKVTEIGKHKIPHKEPAAPKLSKDEFGKRKDALARRFNTDLKKFHETVFVPFSSGWFGGHPSKEFDDYLPVFDALDKSTGDTAALLALSQDPRAYAESIVNQAAPSDLEAYIEAFMDSRKLTDAGEVIEHLKSVGIDPANDSESIAYLRLACRTKSAKLAAVAAKSQNTTVADVVAKLETRLGKPLADAPQSEIEVALANLMSGN